MLNRAIVDGVDRTEEIRGFAEEIGLNRLAPNRYSSFFVIQLYSQSVLSGELSPGRVMNEIESLENPDRRSVTKPATQFQRAHLKGLWHKHHTVSGISSIATNVLNALNRHGTPAFTESVREAEASGEERYFEKEDIDRYIQEVVHDNFEKRLDAGEMTGEWIVYAVHEGKNYYLCLGTHNSGDEVVRQWIDSACTEEFPFLKEILTPLA